MPKYITILICLCVFVNSNAQYLGGGFETYNSYESEIVIDNLPMHALSDEFMAYYTRAASKGAFKMRHIIDETAKTRRLIMTSQKANSGYLHINQRIADKIRFYGGKIYIEYLYNDHLVKTNSDIKKIIRLRRNQVHACKIDLDAKTGILRVTVN